MNRTAKFDFDPMARPAPITCCSVATHHYPTADERMESATAGKRGRPKTKPATLTKPTGNPRFGATMRSDIEADWPNAIGKLVAETSKEAVMAELGVRRETLNGWLRGAHVPSPEIGAKVAAMYHKFIGQQLPKGRGTNA